MRNYPLWKIFIVLSIIFLGIIFAIPSFLYKEDTKNWFLNNKVNLGLDLQGGSYLLLEVQTKILLKEELDNISDSIRLISRELQINLSDVKMETDEIIIRFTSNDNLENLREKFLQNYRNVSAVINDKTIRIIINDLFKKTIQESAIKQSLEIVRKRIDESGTKEPLIQRSEKIEYYFSFQE